MNENGTTTERPIDRIDTRSTEPDLASWLTKAEAARALNSSEKHIERLVRKGQIEQRFRKAKGQARISCFHPGDVEKLVAVANPPFRVLETSVARIDRADIAQPVSDLAASLARLAAFAEENNARYAPQVYVSLDEALRITGLSAETVRGLARAGRIARLSRKYRRKDLEGL